MKLLSFDIEISDVIAIKEGKVFADYAPFHISVAATAIYQGEEKIWFSKDKENQPQLNMSTEVAQELLEYLETKQKEGFMICAWNGLQFDFKWLGYQAKNNDLAAKIALKSYDPMFQFFNQRGFPVGLAKVAETLEIKQEKLMHGKDAPIKWRNGEYQLVMDYVLNDCQMTNQVILAINKAQEIKWITSKGNIASEKISSLKKVDQIIADPDPDQSWMDSPISKLKFYEWTLKVEI